MFDPPSNLPLEPMPETKTPAVPVATSVMSPEPTPVTAPVPKMTTMPAGAPSSPFEKKEPEDIFADIDKPDRVGRPMPETAPPAPRHGSPLKGVLIALAVLLVVGGAGFATWYFLIRQGSLLPTTTTPVPTTQQPIIEQPPVTEPTTTPVVTIPATVPTTTEPVTTPPDGTNIPPPTSVATPPEVIPVEAIDADVDGLRDAEEQLLGTNALLADTDGDGFADGAEVMSGYDPAVPRGVLSLSPWLRKTTIGTNWSFLVPISWTLGNDAVPGDVVIQTGTPATFTFHSGPITLRETFTDWMRINEPTVDVTTLRSFQTKQGNAAWQTSDQLTTYLIGGTSIVRIRYQLNGAISYDYRAIYDMMLEQAIVL